MPSPYWMTRATTAPKVCPRNASIGARPLRGAAAGSNSFVADIDPPGDTLNSEQTLRKCQAPCRGLGPRADEVVDFGLAGSGLWLQVDASRRRNDPRKATRGC